MSDATHALPAISHLQFLALGVLVQSEQPGRVIREVTASFGANGTAAAFYQMMARLEREGFAEGWYDQVQVGDQAVTERRYRISRAGKKAWNETRAFYERVTLAATSNRLSNA